MERDVYQLIKGKTYRVIKTFTDYEQKVHMVGETWVYEEMDYNAYHDGLSLFVLKAGIRNQYRFLNFEEAQEGLIDHFMEYVEMVD